MIFRSPPHIEALTIYSAAIGLLSSTYTPKSLNIGFKDFETKAFKIVDFNDDMVHRLCIITRIIRSFKISKCSNKTYSKLFG